MMTEEKRIKWLLELQDHPEQLTDEQMKQILADDEMRQLVQQLGFAKRAFKHQELKDNPQDVDAEWEKFAATHAEELDALEERDHNPRFALRLPSHKIAASFIGALLVSGIAFAAIWSLTPSRPSTKGEGTEHSQLSDTVERETTPLSSGKEAEAEATHVFNNVPLDSMLTVIAAAHQAKVEFENEAARGLRFHFVWKREDSLARIAEKLNTFDAVNIVVEDKKLVVR